MDIPSARSHGVLQRSTYEAVGSDVELVQLHGGGRTSPRRGSLQTEDVLNPFADDAPLNETDSLARRASAEHEDSRLAGHSPTAAVNKEKKRRLQGWRFGVAASATLAAVVLVVNIVFVVVASLKFSVEAGIGTLFDGDCHYVQQATIWLHLAINLLSTLLLSASNYTMQALCAPTRGEVDAVHAKGDWLDIGVPSVRNVWGRIAKRRIVLWCILGLSSAPIHLIYNSAIFRTIDANDYFPIVAGPEFLNSSLRNATPRAMGYTVPVSYPWFADDIKEVQHYFMDNADTGRIRRLSNSECISAYGTNFVSGYSNLLLVSNDSPVFADQTLFYAQLRAYSPDSDIGSDWICTGLSSFRSGQACNIAKVEREADDWVVFDHKIDHCLAQAVPSGCKLQFSQGIMIVVILMNAAKLFAMLWTYFYQRTTTLVTLGDAVASFLSAPDPATEWRCLADRRDIVDFALRSLPPSIGSGAASVAQARSIPYSPALRRWWRAASARRWATALLLISAALVGTVGLFGIGTNNRYFQGPGQPLSLGFGKADPRLFIQAAMPTNGTTGLIAVVLLANLPQTICSFLYLAYNGLFTCMLSSHEWSGYYLRGKPLRVTTPHGQQRSRYYLQLPFAYSVPLMAASALLHWLISNSIFLVRVDFYSGVAQRSIYSFSRCGYSPLPILLVIGLGVVLLAVLVGHGLRRFGSPMPVVGSCSVAIACACHPPKDDEDAAYLPVAWGDVSADQSSTEVGHCSFTSLSVSAPTEGKMYAGR